MCVRARTHVGAAIFVQSGAEGALKICVGVHTCIKYLKINTNLVCIKKKIVKMCGCGCRCGYKNWCAGVCAAHHQKLCNVCAGAAENTRALKVWFLVGRN